MVQPPKDPRWRRFCDRYVEESGFWYVPKGEAVNDLPRIQRRLSLLKERFSGLPWRSAQLGYVNALKEAGLFTPRAEKQDREDRAAIARMVKVVFDTLGLAWVDEGDAVYVSSTGDAFIKSKSPEEVVEKQLWKYQFWNPSMRGDQYRDFRVFPYAALLEILLRFPDGISTDEYNLFVCRLKTPEGIEQAVSNISNWRKLDDVAQGRIVSYLDNIATESAKTGDDVSLYTRIARVQPYAWALFSSSSPYVERSRESLNLVGGRVAQLRKRIEAHRRDSTFIEFDNEKEWFSYYGDSESQNSYRTAMSVYESRYDIDRALTALRGARERALVAPTLTDESYVETVVREKVIEDILEHRLDLLETGLSLYHDGERRGRQYPTERGIIDLLARDSKGNWVVIELKRQRAGDKVMGQTLRYVGWVKDNKLDSGQKVRGFIVGSSIDENLVSAARGAHPLPIKLFEFDFRLRVQMKYPVKAGGAAS